MASIQVFQTWCEGSNPLSRLAHRSMQLYSKKKEENIWAEDKNAR